MQPIVVASPASASTLRAARPLFLVRAPQRDPTHHESYWPCNSLHAFTLQMAAHGHCVSASMMLGDGHYAREQLAHARRLEDETLRMLAAELTSYFDAPIANMQWESFAAEGTRHDDALA